MQPPTLLARSRSEAAIARPRGSRRDIQALRALAVALVVIYHVTPAKLPGGYIGVDVFFAISGYLISGHIATGLESGRFSITAFYIRRVRRLLPAAAVVLLATAVGILLFVPETMWQEFGKQLCASTFYIENWVLAGNSTQYSAPTADVSPLQHFWSLSVEEQFYLVWPVLLLAAMPLARLLGAPRRFVLLAVLGTAVVASLAYSVVATALSPANAYFLTTTRAWEFALGGMLAVALRGRRLPAVLRRAASWLGLALILGPALAYNATTPFPGWLALVPVGGALLILAGDDVGGRGSPAFLFGLRPVQYLGDISYSLYLWHWPLIVLLPMALTADLSTRLRVVIVGLSLVAAALTKRFVEDPFRGARPFRRSGRVVIRAGATVGSIAVSAGLVVLLGAGAAVAAAHDTADAQRELRAVRHRSTPTLGAGSRPDPMLDRAAHIVPSPLVAQTDWLGTTPSGRPCQDTGATVVPAACAYGSAPGALRVALVGDSHAAQWQPALAAIAARNNWRLTLLSHSGCPLTDTMPQFRGVADTVNCARWNANAMQLLTTRHFDTVFVAALAGTVYTAGDGGVSGFLSAWRRVAATGAKVVAIRDSPNPTLAGVPDADSCVARRTAHLSQCAFSRRLAIVQDPVATAAVHSRVPVVDLTDAFCDAPRCPAVVGNVLVYRDRNHLTGTFARTLAPRMEAQLRRLLPGWSWKHG